MKKVFAWNAALALLISSAAMAQTARELSPLPSLSPLVDAVKSAVVNVEVQSRSSRAQANRRGPGDLFDEFFGPRGGRERIQQGAGSGFIIDPSGLVLTNNHVVDGAVSIRVKLDDGREFTAKTLGRDPLTDVALLKLEGKVERLRAVPLGDSDAMKVGDWVVAIGNPFGLASSVSAGIISARARDIRVGPYDDFLQTDAAINFGNSGGPLFNLRGEVIGINTAIVGNGASGIGFAVPSNMAKGLLPQLREGQVRRGWLGIGIQPLSAELAKALKVPVAEGALVSLVTEGSPAEKAGLKVDDVVVALDGEKVTSDSALTRMVGQMKPESQVTVTYFRDGKRQQTQVKLGLREPELVASAGGRGGPSEPAEQQKLGITYQEVDPRLAEGTELPERGALIVAVAPGSPADRADLRRGMVVVEANRRPVRNAADLTRTIREAKAGTTLLLRVVSPTGMRALRVLTMP